MGRLIRDFELRYILGIGILVVFFIIVIDRDYVKKDGFKEIDFIFVEVMGKFVEFCVNYIIKGRLVVF